VPERGADLGRWGGAVGNALLTGAALLAASALAVPIAHASQRFAAQGEVEVAFAPRDDTEKVLIELIRSARKSLKVQAYVFTSRKIADAMVAAHRRGVKVEVLADAHMNRRDKGNAIPRLLAGGVPVAFETRYNAAHNKVLVVDAEGPWLRGADRLLQLHLVGGQPQRREHAHRARPLRACARLPRQLAAPSRRGHAGHVAAMAAPIAAIGR
jgi:Phosphatidylserine/phosphatidylglycerophosphate/cardiolipin synthases and related enzymes